MKWNEFCSNISFTSAIDGIKPHPVKIFMVNVYYNSKYDMQLPISSLVTPCM